MNQNQAQNYWTHNPNAASVNQWTSHPQIAREVYRRMSGGKSDKHWLTWLLEDYFGDRQFKNVLSAGCGVGDHEIMLAKSGKFQEIDAFDFSASSIELAQDKAKKENLQINFYQDDLNSFQPKKSHYDLVLCSGSLHHTRELESFLSKVQKLISPDGYFVINEYIGACYNVYPPEQVELINRVLACFPEKLRSGKLDYFSNHSIEQALQTDPSESVRSKLIPDFLTSYFDFELYQPFGGFLLHPLYPLLNNQILAQPEAEMESIINLLLEIEKIMMEKQNYPSDFLLAVMKAKK